MRIDFVQRRALLTFALYTLVGANEIVSPSCLTITALTIMTFCPPPPLALTVDELALVFNLQRQLISRSTHHTLRATATAGRNTPSATAAVDRLMTFIEFGGELMVLKGT